MDEKSAAQLCSCTTIVLELEPVNRFSIPILSASRKVVLAYPEEMREVYTDEFDGLRMEWLKRFWIHIDSARTTYSKGRISSGHLKAAAKSVPKLMKRWNRNSYSDDDMKSELPLLGWTTFWEWTQLLI